jgi:hypothetical protein
LSTDLQLGYEISDKSSEINSVIQAITTATSRSNVVQSDDKTRIALNSLTAIGNQLRNSPVNFFNELSAAASSRANNEAWHITRIRSNYAALQTALNVLLNVTGPLSNLNDVTNPFIVAIMRSSLARVQSESSLVLSSSEQISRDVSRVRANSSLLLTPEIISDFLDPEASKQVTSSLMTIRNSFAVLLSAVRDSGRLIVAHGSIHQILSQSFTRDATSRNTALSNFVNNYNRVRNNLLSSVTSYRQTAETGIYNFVARVRSTYDDTIVRPRFDQLQLPLIDAFANVISSKVYNQTFFQSSFDTMRDSILSTFSTATNLTLSEGSDKLEVVLDLQRSKFVRKYSSCLNELVSEAQDDSNSVTSKYAFCLNERTSGIVVVIPSTSTWMSVIRDNINFILQQLNACFNGLTTVAGRTATSDCIQFVSEYALVRFVQLNLIVYFRTLTIFRSTLLTCR